MLFRSMEPGQKDQVKLLKMSKIDNREQTDSVLAKISSGVHQDRKADGAAAPKGYESPACTDEKAA